MILVRPLQREGIEPSWEIPSGLKPDASASCATAAYQSCPRSESNAHYHASETCPSTRLGYEGVLRLLGAEVRALSPGPLPISSLQEQGLPACLRPDSNRHYRASQTRLSTVGVQRRCSVLAAAGRWRSDRPAAAGIVFEPIAPPGLEPGSSGYQPLALPLC